jgi:hypothetical protein
VSATDDAAAVLAQVVEVGSGSGREAELGAAVSRHISGGPVVRGSQPDPEVAAGLRSLGQQPSPSLQVQVVLDVAALTLQDLDRVLVILDRLKERLG